MERDGHRALPKHDAVRSRVIECEMFLAEAEMVTVEDAALGEVSPINVSVFASALLSELNLAETPAGSPDAVKVTLSSKAFSGVSAS